MRHYRPLLPAILLFLFAGCQHYSPRPLDLRGHGNAVESRDPSASEVVSYAADLARRRDAAERYDPTDGLTLQEAEVVALFFNPRLRAARLKARVPLAGAAEAGRWEDPELGVDIERIIESVEHPWVLGGMLSFTVPLSGRLKLAKGKALAEADVEQLRAYGQEQTLLAELAAAWLEWSATTERIVLSRNHLKALEDAAQTAERLRQAGELDPLDARLFRIERVTQSGKLQSLESQASAEEVIIRARLGLNSHANVVLRPSLTPTTRPAPTTQEAFALAETHPRVAVARAEYEVAERNLELEIRRQYPDLGIGGGFGTDEGQERLLGGVGLPIPLLNANRRAIAEARAARETARATVEAEYEELLNQLASARLSAEGAEARLRFVEGELAPLADEQLTAARNLGKLGDYNTLVLLEALKTAFDAKLEVLEARLRLGLAQVQVNTLAQPDRTTGGTSRKEDR